MSEAAKTVAFGRRLKQELAWFGAWLELRSKNQNPIEEKQFVYAAIFSFAAKLLVEEGEPELALPFEEVAWGLLGVSRGAIAAIFKRKPAGSRGRVGDSVLVWMLRAEVALAISIHAGFDQKKKSKSAKAIAKDPKFKKGVQKFLQKKVGHLDKTLLKWVEDFDSWATSDQSLEPTKRPAIATYSLLGEHIRDCFKGGPDFPNASVQIRAWLKSPESEGLRLAQQAVARFGMFETELDHARYLKTATPIRNPKPKKS